MLKIFEIENANLKQLLEVATQEKLEAQNAPCFHSMGACAMFLTP